jgi:hypothetical protein
MSGQLHAPTALLPEENPSKPLETLGGSQSLSGHCGEEKIFLSMPGIELWPLNTQLVTIPSDLFT